MSGILAEEPLASPAGRRRYPHGSRPASLGASVRDGESYMIAGRQVSRPPKAIGDRRSIEIGRLHNAIQNSLCPGPCWPSVIGSAGNGPADDAPSIVADPERVQPPADSQ